MVARVSKNLFIWLVLLSALGLVFYLLVLYLPQENDWQRFYSHLAENITHPNQVDGYINPPWAAMLVLYGLLPFRFSNALNMLINILVLLLLIRKVGGGWLGIVLTFTSPLFWDMGRVNPIDWIPVLGFILPPAWGLPLMAVKPQTLGAAVLIKWKNEKFAFAPLIPLIAVVLASFLIWGNWLPSGTSSLLEKPWNFSFWPLSVPLGIYLFYKAYKNGDEILAGASTSLLVPYIAPYSLACLIPLLSGKYKKAAAAIYMVSIWYFVIEARRLSLLP